MPFYVPGKMKGQIKIMLTPTGHAQEPVLQVQALCSPTRLTFYIPGFFGDTRDNSRITLPTIPMYDSRGIRSLSAFKICTLRVCHRQQCDLHNMLGDAQKIGRFLLLAEVQGR